MSKAHKSLFKAFRNGSFAAMLPKSVKVSGKRVTTTRQIGNLTLKKTDKK